MKTTIINPPSTFPPYLHSRSLAVSHHRFLPLSLPPLAPSVHPTFYSPLSFPAPRCPPASCRATHYTPCVYSTVYSLGALQWVLCREGPARRRYAAYAARRGTETMEWLRHQQVPRCYLANEPPPPRLIRFLTNSKKIRRSKRATNTHKHGRSSYLSVGTGGDVQTLLEAEPLRSKDRGLHTYNIDIYYENVIIHLIQ